MKLAIFGYPFSHTDQASFDFGRNAKTEVFYFPTIFQAFEAVEKGETEGGIVPYENSTRGAVFETLDELFDREGVHITGLKEREIHQCLLGLKEAEISDIKSVISHPQALAQSRRKLSKEASGVVFEPRSSTALAAREVFETKDPSLAAIGSQELANHLGLKVLLSHLEEAENRTKFVFISKKAFDPKAPHTGMVFWFSADKAGNLAKLLTFLADKSLNLTKLDSRRAPAKYGGYIFFIDVAAPLEYVQSLGYDLETLVEGYKILGTY
ncbi:MAG TPA: prephenate dehydratase domain-containing protein [Candidatus Gracilibacteria bacterium]